MSSSGASPQEPGKADTGFEASVRIKDLYDAGVHYGHRSRLWNPLMAPYIFRDEGGVHVIDLTKTYAGLVEAMAELYRAGASNKRVLFVGTKPHCSKLIKRYAIECGQYYVNHRWLGGMLTNWTTVRHLFGKLDRYEKLIAEDDGQYTKKELLLMTRQVERLERVVGGIRNLSSSPDYVVVVDANVNRLAILEAKKIGAQVIAVVDTNASPRGVDIVVPGNDDSMKSIDFYLKSFSEAILQGIRKSIISVPKSNSGSGGGGGKGGATRWVSAKTSAVYTKPNSAGGKRGSAGPAASAASDSKTAAPASAGPAASAASDSKATAPVVPAASDSKTAGEVAGAVASSGDSAASGAVAPEAAGADTKS